MGTITRTVKGTVLRTNEIVVALEVAIAYVADNRVAYTEGAQAPAGRTVVRVLLTRTAGTSVEVGPCLPLLESRAAGSPVP